MTITHSITSEAVSQGHPDKIADQISDAILDACLEQDIHSRVACETLVTNGLVFIAGEISSQSQFDLPNKVREVIHRIGYVDPLLGFDFRTCGILSSIHRQSPDIAMGVNKKNLGAGDQGFMYGYACDETEELMPLPITLCYKILAELKNSSLPFLGPDAKTQVTVDYENHLPKRIAAVVLSSQHRYDVEIETIRNELLTFLKKTLPSHLIDGQTLFFINPTGRFVIGGPQGDTGLTGRKIIADTYGGVGRHGGGAFSGKDPTKVDRSGAYMARYIAKNIVASKLAKRCEIQLAYAIGISEPLALNIETFGTETISQEKIHDLIKFNFQLSPQGIIDQLDLLRPIYQKTATGGHFGRKEPEFTWEKIIPPFSDEHLVV